MSSFTLTIIGLIATACIFTACKRAKKDSTEKDVIAYLSERYSEQFEIVKIVRTKSPGAPSATLEIRAFTKSHPRRTFMLFLHSNARKAVPEDHFPELLLEDALLRSLDFSKFETFPCVVETRLNLFRSDPQKKETVNEATALKALKVLEKASWTTSFAMIVNDVKKDQRKMETQITACLELIGNQVSGRHSVHIYLYTDQTLTKSMISPDMNEFRMSRVRHKDKVTEEWIIGFNPARMQKKGISIQEVIETKRVLPKRN